MDIPRILSHYFGPFEILNEHASVRLLRWLRTFVFGLWMFKLFLDPLWRLAYMPLSALRPLGIISPILTEGQIAAVYSVTGLTTLWIACFGLCFLTFIPRLFVYAATLAAPALTFYSTVIRAYGDPVHTDVVLIWTTWSLALFAWADVYLASQVPPNGPKYVPDARWPLFTMILTLTTGYVLVGLSRITVGGLPVFLGTNMEHFVIDASVRAYYFNTGIGWHVPEYPLIAWSLRLGFPVVTVMEILAPLVFIWPKFRWFFIPFMLSFHFLSLVFMNIFFFDDMLAYFFMFDWDRPLKPWMRALWSRFARVQFAPTDANVTLDPIGGEQNSGSVTAS